MDIILHAGAHFTEDGRLMKSLLRNKAQFARAGVSVPGPGRYRELLRDATAALKLGAPAPGARDVLLDQILEEDVTKRVILSNANFFGAPRSAVRDGFFYPNAVERFLQLRRLFPDDRFELFLAIRNPAAFLPAVFERSPRRNLAALLDGVDPRELRWSDLVASLRSTWNDMPITVWCSEDAPLIWADILRAMAGLPGGTKLTGAFDLLSAIMSQEGMQRFRAYLKANPVMSEVQKRRAMIAFLDKFAVDEAIEEELDLPGWTDAMVADLTEGYDADLERIRAIRDVRLLLPWQENL